MHLDIDNKIVMTQAERLILEKLERIEKELKRLREDEAEYNIEEISLNKASKLLHIGYDKLKRLAESGKIRAICYRDREKKKRYRFRLADIRDYQKKRQPNIEENFVGIETAEEIAKRIFNI